MAIQGEIYCNAKAAVEREWNELMNLDAFDVDAMMAQEDVIIMYDEHNKPTFLGQFVPFAMRSTVR